MDTYTKKTVAIIFGGQSAEHEISVRSAGNILEAMDTDLFTPIPIGICQNGQWCYFSSINDLKGVSSLKEKPPGTESVTLSPGHENNLFFLDSSKKIKIDVAFPVLHGPMGEDGSIQGLFRICNIPFVGCDTLGSAIGMDKDIMKRLFKESDLPMGAYKVLYKNESRLSYEDLVIEIGSPFFIKPANMGSSLGVHKIYTKKEFEEKLLDAFSFDHKVIAEQYISGRELECAVLGNSFSLNPPRTSGVGEIISQHDFYSYEAKYLDDNGAVLSIPAQLENELAEKIQTISLQAFKCLELSGLSRVDFFLDNTDQIYINEINTMPGFTNISMYPKLWEQKGLSYNQLITTLLNLAMEQYRIWAR